MQSVSVAYARLERDTFKRLEKRPRYIFLKDIAAATGISEAWLKNYSSGRIKKPDISNLEKINRYFQALV